MKLLSSAERLLAATGDAVTLCATNELPRVAATADPAESVGPPRVGADTDG